MNFYDTKLKILNKQLYIFQEIDQWNPVIEDLDSLDPQSSMIKLCLPLFTVRASTQ